MNNYPFFKVLGVPVNAVQIIDVIHQIEDWLKVRLNSHFVAVTAFHGIMEADKDPTFKRILNSADLIVPDGMPLIFLGRAAGFSLKRRVYGPELMETFLSQTADKYRHFLYGGLPGVAQRLAQALSARYPRLQLVGTFSPPFSENAPEEDKKLVDLISESQPDIIWVGLSSPKQERWMFEHRDKLKVPVMIGVGAAFDFLAKLKPQAPKWMGENGLEWIFRLITEPKRLAYRYLVLGPKFCFLVLLEKLGLRKSD